ncbi:MAG: hypothetical protein J0H86_05550 [Xanthomonadaceae bacterium]|nr:hypothetical protein [Xanthomonadaceae bacterium]
MAVAQPGRHLSVDLYPRSYDQVENLDRSAQFVLVELRSSDGRVSAQAASARSCRRCSR